MFLGRNPFRIFYGWWIVFAAFLTAMYVGGVVFYSFTAFIEPIARETGWSYTQISLAASLRGLEMGLLSPVVGIMADRWGPRRVIFSGVALVVTGLLLLSSAHSLFVFYGAFALLAVGISACTVTALLTAIANWFRTKMGLATGMAIAGFGFSGLIVPVVVGLIDAYDWRQTLVILALAMLVLILPLSLVFRHRPEQYGYFPDGEEPEKVKYSTVPGRDKIPDVEINIGKALKTRTFWRLALTRLYHIMVVATVVTHVMPYLGSIGSSRARSGLVATAIPLISVLGRLGFGWLGDRLDKRLVATVTLVMMGSGIFCFAFAGTLGLWLLVPFLLLMGIGYGGSNIILPMLGRDYFGRRNFGSIYGVIQGIGAVGGIIGPAVAGWTYDTLGDYQVIWLILAGLAAVAVLLVSTVTPVRTEADADGNDS